MPLLLCETHNITLDLGKSTRTASINMNMNQTNRCSLLSDSRNEKNLKLGQINDCVIKKIKD
jgi:hypothetical protein